MPGLALFIVTPPLSFSPQAYRFRPKPERFSPDSALVVTEHDRGVRLVTLCGGNMNALDAPLLRALRVTLERFERNPAVTMVILTGRDAGIFSSGIDTRSLARAAAESPGAAAAALATLRESYALSTLVATFTKPIVASLDGLTAGAGWAIGANSEYSYATPRTAIVFPETGQGLVPTGGSTYHLSRLGGGRGLWLALTGAVVEGEDAYWVGAARLWGASHGVSNALAKSLLKDAGAVSRPSASELTPLSKDELYVKALASRRDYRSEGIMELLSNNRSGEEIDNDTFEEYVRYKRWYSYFAVGDRTNAALALESEDEIDAIGDLFFAGQRREDFGGPNDGEGAEGSYTNEPFAAQEERRARIGATSAHAASLFTGSLSAGPSAALTERLLVVKEVFSGSAPGTPTSLASSARVSEEPLAEELAAAASARVAKTRERIAAAVSTPLPSSWEVTLAASVKSGRPRSIKNAVTVTSCIQESADRLGISLSQEGSQPSQSALPPADLLQAMVRLSVSAAWPTGFLQPKDADSIISRFLRGGASGETPGGARGRSDVVRVLTAAAARITAALHALPEWSLLDESAVGISNADVQGPSDVAAAIAAHSAVTSLRDPVLEGPSEGFWISPVPRTMSVSKDFGDNNQELPITPRLANDPDALWYDAHEDDFLWPFTEGHWAGDKDFMGEKDSFVIFPTGSWAPAAKPHPAMAAAAVARADMLKLVTIALRDPAAYCAPAAAHARATPSEAEAVRSRLFGTPGEMAYAKLVERYESSEGPAGVLAPADEYALRARATLVWPQLRARIVAARVIVYKGIAAAGRVSLRAPDAAALADAGIDTAEGYMLLKAAGKGGNVEASRLCTLWDSMIVAATPPPQPEPPFQSRGNSAAASATRTAPPQLPSVNLSNDDAESLRKLAQSFAAWEGVWLGNETGGSWVRLAGKSNDVERDVYRLAETRDAETGRMRITLELRSSNDDATPKGRAPVFTSLGAARRAVAAAESRALETSRSMSSPLNRLMSLQSKGSESSASSSSSASNAKAEVDPSGGEIPPFRAPILAEPAASEAALRLSHWDYDAVFRALTDSTGSGVANLFGLPLNATTQSAGALVSDYFVAEATGRVPASAPVSVSEVRSRLSSIACAASSSTARSSFARETLSAINAAPQGAPERTFDLLQAAARAPIAECMNMEFRASARLLGLAASVSNDSALWSAPLDDASELNAARLRPAGTDARAVVAAREAMQSKWENALEVYLSSGEAGGVVGDLFRRRYAYFKSPLSDLPFDENALSGLAQIEERARAETGEVDIFTESQQRLGLSPQSQRGGLRDPRDRERDENIDDISYEAARIVAEEGRGSVMTAMESLAKISDDAAASRKNAPKSLGGQSAKHLRGVPLWLQ